MTDRWAGRTVLRGSLLQFAAVELSGPVAHGGHGAEPLRAACSHPYGNEVATEAAGPAAGVSARGLAALRLPSGRQEGPDWPGTISWLRTMPATRSIPRLPGGGRAASARLVMTK